MNNILFKFMRLKNPCKDKKMTNKVTMLFFLILFYSCAQPSKDTYSTKDNLNLDVIELAANSFISELSGELHEISGIISYDGLFWGFNDSGGEAMLYGFGMSGRIEQKIPVINAGNIDWESITQDESYIYVGDFGNNLGNRQDLCIYKIDKQQIERSQEHNSGVEAQKLEIRYAPQTDFSRSSGATSYDCEAMVEFNEDLYLFSKDWADRMSVYYKVEPDISNQELIAIDTFDVKGLVTGADINPDGNKLALLGYENYKAFIWLFTDFEEDNFFKGNALRIDLPDLDNAQTEGICFFGNDSLLVSCENSMGIPQQVFLVDIITP